MEETLKEIFLAIFDLEESEINDHLKAGDYEPWDSTAHLMIITEIEATFDIMISEELIPELNSYAKLKNELIKRGFEL